jgi:NAD(P)-dependent dehydrogenase (short-subunit alcohol dehydrogenase family)
MLDGTEVATVGKQQRVIVVTGASAGVGRAIVREFARRERCKIGLLARGHDGLAGAAREVSDAGSEPLVLPTDVAEHEQVESAAKSVEARLGPIDIWINVAMVTVMAPVMEITAEEFERVTRVTYLGYVHGTQSALRRMLPRDRGLVIQIGSALGLRSIPLQAPYCAAKHAIVGFTESLRTELLHDRSRVKLCMLHLPAVNTPQFEWGRNRMPHEPQPVPPIYQPEVIARAAHWVSLHPRRDMALSWSSLKAIVGEKVSPSLADLYLARTGYRSQQREERADPDRLDNLYAPVPGDHGAHGVFDDRSRRHSSRLLLSTRGPWIAGAALAAGLGLAAYRQLRG